MIVKKKPAVHLSQQAAGQTEFQNLQYSKPAMKSSLKIHIGELLLFGDRKQGNFWKRFESKLRRYADLQIFGGHYGYGA